MLSSEVAQSLKSYGHSFGPWGRDRNTSIHGLGEDDEANCRPAREAPETLMTKNKRHTDLQARRNYPLFSTKRNR